MHTELLKETISATLRGITQVSGEHYAIIGLDGFIDKIQRPVKTQGDSGSSYYSSLEGFGQRIKDAADQSAQIELHTVTVKLGGNAPIFANALAALGIDNTCLGTFGKPQIHPVFSKMNDRCDILSLGNAAETNALEFDDGKLILSELSAFAELDWERVKTQLDLNHLAKLAAKASLIGLVDWCNLPHASDIWSGFYRDIVQPNVDQQPRFFFDLADPSKKTSSQVNQVISIINQFAQSGKVTLGLNENECLQLCRFLGLEVNITDENERLLKMGRLLFDFMTIDQLVIHPLDGCFLFTDTDSHYLPGRVVVHPEVSTGGGDNFNSGFCFGLLHGFDRLPAMVLAMAGSGAYVQNGGSPSSQELVDYLRQWLSEL